MRLRLWVEGRLRWMRSASTGKYSLIFVHDRRGTQGVDAVGVLPEFAGVAVHDAWTLWCSKTRCSA
jgi:transposase